MKYRIETYTACDQSQAQGPRAYVAYLHMVKGACMNFWGSAEAEAREKAEAWLRNQLKKTKGAKDAD